jgi:hypothetical protein
MNPGWQRIVRGCFKGIRSSHHPPLDWKSGLTEQSLLKQTEEPTITEF